MLKKKTIASLVFVFLLPSLALASDISCRVCTVADCTCTISICASGILEIFNTSSCTIYPSYEYIFSEGVVSWTPQVARSYSVKALCSDGLNQSECETIIVKSAQETTTTVGTTTTRISTTTQPSLPVEESNYLLFGLIGVLIVVIAFAVYYLFLRKKPGKSYEEIYRKWGRK